MELMQANRQWASRPADERFTSLTDLDAHFADLRLRSQSKVVSSRRLELVPDENDPIKGLMIRGQNGTDASMNHWSFAQVAALAGAPAGYMRTLPAVIAADAMNYGLKFNRDIEDVGVLLTKEPNHVELRAATGPRYGRVWNSEITSALIQRFGNGLDGDFKVPGEFGKDVAVTKDNTTIYGSDRDMFVFLADEKNRVSVPNRRHGNSGSLARGFFVWNSEVGSQSIGAAFFLFDYACSNRIVWGAQGFKEMRLRHTVSAPDRWIEEITPVLVEYANSAAGPIEQTIAAAQAKKLDKVEDFLANRFTRRMANLVMTAHEREENRPIETLWDAVTGITAHAKSIKHQDDRVGLERNAGKLLDLVAA